MPTASAQYRFRIYSTDDTTVETTFDTQLQGWDAVGGQEIRALDGRTEGRPWSVKVVDYSTAVTNDLADSSGRLRRIGRLADFQQNLDSSGWATLATGRISDVFLGEDVASYQFVLEDEHLLAREALIFNTTSHDPTVYLYPPGLRDYWLGMSPRQLGNAKLLRRTVNLSVVLFDSTAPVAALAMQELERDLLDIKNNYWANTTKGNFKFLRFHGNGADYEVFGIGTDGAPDLLSLLRLPSSQQTPLAVWVVDPSTALGSATYPVAVSASTVGVITGCYLYSPGLPPSEGQPWHIGGNNGQRPGNILRDIYDSSYGGRAIRYDSTALTTLANNNVLPLSWYRITDIRRMGEFTESAIYGTFGCAGFVSRDGRIMPRTLFMPSTDDADQTSLARLTASTMRAPHPTWEHTRRELVTVIEYPWLGGEKRHQLSDRDVVQLGYQVAADMIRVQEEWYTYEHDRLTAGRYTHRLPNEAWTDGNAFQATLAREIFDRYGDGPVTGQIACLSSGTSGILPGDFVRLNLATYPNMGIQGRGSTRIVQVLSVMDTPHGPVFDYLDAGPDQNPLPTPTIALTSSTEDSPANKHRVFATIGGVPTTLSLGAGVELQIANQSTQPVANSTLWEAAGHYTSSDTYPLDRLPSGAYLWARGRARAAGFWRSPWAVTTAYIRTGSLGAPSAVQTSSPTMVSVNVSWTNSTDSTGYPIQIAYDVAASTAPFNAYQVVDGLAPGTNRYALKGMTQTSDSRSVAVRYFDPFGGFSTYVESSDFSSTGIPTAATVGALSLLYGVNTTAEVY